MSSLPDLRWEVKQIMLLTSNVEASNEETQPLISVIFMLLRRHFNFPTEKSKTDFIIDDSVPFMSYLARIHNTRKIELAKTKWNVFQYYNNISVWQVKVSAVRKVVNAFGFVTGIWRLDSFCRESFSEMTYHTQPVSEDTPTVYVCLLVHLRLLPDVIF